MKKTILTLLFFLGIQIIGVSQTYNFNSYTEENGLPSNTINSIVQDSKGYLWIGTDKGLSRFDGNNFVNFDELNGMSENEISAIWVDKNDELYLSHKNTNKVSKVLLNNVFEVLDSLPNLIFYNDSINTIQCNIINKKEIIIDYEEPLKLSKSNGLKINTINEVFIDRENILWIGSEGSGLFSLPLQNFPSYTWKANQDLKYVHVLSKENYLLTYSKSIVRANFSNKKPVYTSLFNTENKKLNCAIYQYGNELYYGTDNGLYLYFDETKADFSFKELLGKKVTYIEKIGGGNLIIIADNRVYRYFVYNNEMKIYAGFENFKANSIIKIGRKIYVLGDGNVYEAKNNTLIPLLKEEIKNSSFVHISPSKKEGYWLSTASNGVFYIDFEKDSVINFNRQKNFPYTSILNSTEDENTLWITTRNGITNFNLKQNAYQFYGEKYLGKTSFLPFTINSNNGNYILSKKGLIKLYDTKVFKSKESNLSLTNIIVSGKKKEIDSIISIDYNQFPLEFKFQSISFNNKIFYQYRLIGVDKNWSTASLNSSARYESLEPGEYVFKARTYDPINKIALDEISQKFRVNPPFWKTVAFVYLMIGIIAFLIFVFYLLRVWRLNKQKQKLERMVDEKTFVLTAQNQNIEQFSYSLSHDLKNPINNIKGLVEIMEGAKREEQEEIRKMLLSSAMLLEDKIKATLRTIKQMQANKKNVELLHFEVIYEQVKRSLLIMVNESNVKFNIDFKAKSILHNQSILESVFYNLISNSIKYGPTDKQAKIKISSERKEEKIVLTFEDNGKGIDLENDMDKVFSIFERVDENNETTGTGIGLYMVKQMIELNGGSIAIESEVGVGTKFYVTLSPMNN